MEYPRIRVAEEKKRIAVNSYTLFIFLKDEPETTVAAEATAVNPIATLKPVYKVKSNAIDVSGRCGWA